MVLAKNVRQTIGKRGEEIIGQADVQILRLEELGYGGQRFVKQAGALVEDSLVEYLCTPKGKAVQGEICIVIPFECRKPNRAMEIIGSGRPLAPQVDLDMLVDKFNAPNSPYIICDVRVEQTANLAGGRRHLTRAEVISWCTMNDPEPETAFLSLNSRAGGQYVGIEFDRNKNPRITPFAEKSGIILSCAKAFIA